MALTIKHNPDLRYMSAHGDLVFVLLEDTKPFDVTTYPDYKYICDVYIVHEGVEALAVRLKSFPRPGDKYGVFDIGNIVRNYISTRFLPKADNFVYTQTMNDGEFYVNVICRFGEEYFFTTYPNIVIDSQRAYFNHYNDRLYGVNTILNNFLDKFLTSRPYQTNVDRNSRFCLLPLMTSDDSGYNIDVKCYNLYQGLVRQHSYSFTPTVGSIDEMGIINVSPVTINANYPGPGAMIDDYIDYYTITFNTPNAVNDSIYRFNITCERKNEVHTLHFLNKYGGFESKEFTKVSRKTIEVDRSEYRKTSYSINSNGSVSWFDSSSSVYNEQSSVFASSWTDKMQLNTDILNDAEYRWLAELIKSPMVYCFINGYFYSVKITDNNYEERKIINDKLTNLTLNIEFGERFNAQYR